MMLSHYITCPPAYFNINYIDLYTHCCLMISASLKMTALVSMYESIKFEIFERKK